MSKFEQKNNLKEGLILSDEKKQTAIIKIEQIITRELYPMDATEPVFDFLKTNFPCVKIDEKMHDTITKAMSYSSAQEAAKFIVDIIGEATTNLE